MTFEEAKADALEQYGRIWRRVMKTKVTLGPGKCAFCLRGRQQIKDATTSTCDRCDVQPICGEMVTKLLDARYHLTDVLAQVIEAIEALEPKEVKDA